MAHTLALPWVSVEAAVRHSPPGPYQEPRELCGVVQPGLCCGDEKSQQRSSPGEKPSGEEAVITGSVSHLHGHQ